MKSLIVYEALVFLTANITFALKMRSAPSQPPTESGISEAIKGPSNAANKILDDEIIPPSTAVTYLKPNVSKYCPPIPKNEHVNKKNSS